MPFNAGPALRVALQLTVCMRVWWSGGWGSGGWEGGGHCFQTRNGQNRADPTNNHKTIIHLCKHVHLEGYIETLHIVQINVCKSVCVSFVSLTLCYSCITSVMNFSVNDSNVAKAYANRSLCKYVLMIFFLN